MEMWAAPNLCPDWQHSWVEFVITCQMLELRQSSRGLCSTPVTNSDVAPQNQILLSTSRGRSSYLRSSILVSERIKERKCKIFATLSAKCSSPFLFSPRTILSWTRNKNISSDQLFQSTGWTLEIIQCWKQFSARTHFGTKFALLVGVH